MSLLNVVLPLNKLLMSVTFVTSHVLMSPYVTVAAASSATHASTAVCSSALSAGVNTTGASKPPSVIVHPYVLINVFLAVSPALEYLLLPPSNVMFVGICVSPASRLAHPFNNAS